MFTNRQSSKRFLVTGLVALYTAVPTWIGLQADDTEIYVNKVPEAQVPNALFTIDTSGSMGNDVPGGGQTRMEAVKDALTGLINDTDNLKAGLERFHNELGAPIIFPITSLTDTPEFLNESVDVSSIDRATDDVEEAGGVVDLGGSSLEMTIFEEGGDLEIFEIEAQPLQSSDDDEDGTAGFLSITSNDIDDADSGIRFRNVAIPQGATILHAEIELVNNSNSSAKSDKIIHGHDVDDSPTFTETGPDSVASRFTSALTDANVPWSNISEDIDSGDAVTSPNIHAVVQEIVNRTGWAAGNDLTILLENITDNHEFSSFDDDFPPVLRVSYIVGGTTIERDINATARDANEDASGVNTTLNGFYLLRDERFGGATDELTHAGLIFPNVDIPDSAEVVWADVEFITAFDYEENLSSSDLNTADMEVLGIANPQLSGFSAGNPITGQPTTTAQVDWIAGLSQGDEEIFTPDEDEPLYTPNLAAIVEELRAAPDFDRGDNNKNNVGFVFRDPDGTGFNTRTTCSFDGDAGYGCPETVEQPPTLRLVYGTPSPVTTVNQQVGLRFNNVLVPQGAQIESAYLEFTVAGETSTTGTLDIEIEDNTAPVTYSNNAGERVSDRTYAGGSVSWSPDAWDTIGEVRQSPDIKGLVEQVTNQSGWCGGGSLAFRITSSDARNIAEAWDAGGSGAPTLRIDYDASGLSAGEGCTTRQLTVAIDDEDDDVEESSNDGSIDFNSGDLDIEDGYLVGLRFTDVDIPLGANILSTNLLLDADDPNPDAGTHTITIKAQQHPNAPPFTNAQYDVSSRDYSTLSIDWTETTTWNEGTTYSPQDDGLDLTPLIADIIDGTVTVSGEQWAAGNALLFTLQGSASGNDRDAEVCCGQADSPARLEIFYEIFLGDLGAAGSVTARQALLNVIDDLVADGFTPPVDALLEGAYYFASEPVHFGRTRGAGQSYETSGVTNDSDLDSQIAGQTDAELLEKGEKSRLSHFATYTPQTATVNQTGNCTDANPNDPDCADEHIDNAASATYVSPFETAESCEKGFLVLLSDGIANRNSSRDLIQNLTGQASCEMDIPNIDTSGDAILNGDGSFNVRVPSSDELCGLEVADWLHDTDFIDEPDNPVDVRNNVRTFTIGFDLEGNTEAVEFLKALAFVGNGGNLDDPDGVEDVSYGDGFYTANNAEQLQDVFEIIVNEIIDETTSFVAPGISVNAFNRLFNLDDIYFSLFRPDDNVAWLGNLKKFKLCDGQPDCEFGETIDRGGQPAVNLDESDLDAFGTLKVDAVGFWSDPNDDSAPEINQGGAGEMIPTHTARNVYVNTSDGAVPAPDFTDPVKDQGTALHKVDLTSDTDGTPATADDYNDLKTALLDANNCDSGSATLDEQNDCLNELIEWITGKKFEGDIPRDGSDDDVDRWAFGDPMHSRPLVLTYGRDVRDASDPDDDVPLSKIIVGTNDGGVRMINEGDGVEEWIFHPNSMLGIQSVLKDNPKGAHEYGIDDTPTARIKDTDDDNVIDPALGDFAHLYFGLRRGGRQVFALNITPESTVGLDSTVTWNAGTDNEFVVSIGEKGKVVPEVLWRIDGTDPLFQRLGMSWSTPRPVRIAGNSGPRTVLIFGGGYDSATQDGEDMDGTSPDGGDNYTGPSGSALGNAIFIVDADTGERLWWASSSPDGNGDAADAVVPDMNTSIPAPVAVLDTNGDGLIDRLYAVDMRGQVFRIDIEANPSPAADESEFSNSTVGTLARLGSISANEDRRKFFYAPEVARVNDESLVTEPYELVGIISGNRAEPQGKTVLDRVYAIRDFRTENPSGGLSSSNFPKCNPQATTCPTAGEPLTHSELTNVTEKSSFVIRNEDGSLDADSDAAIDNLAASHGWYFDLEGEEFDDGDPLVTPLTGEKGFSAATVLDGKMFFTTFLPPEDTSDTSDACTAPEVLGTSRFYAVDFFTGAPVFDTNGDSDFDKGERFQSLGAGPSADVIPAYLPGGVTLPVPTGAGAIAKDPEISQKVNKTFWLEEQ